MTFKTITHNAAAIILICFFGLPSHAFESSKDSTALSYAGYVKPGAAISLRHNYDGQTEKGELETFTLTLEHIYTDGYLTTRLLSPPELQIQSDMQAQQIRLDIGSTLSVPVQFSTTQAGEYYLGVEVIYETLTGDQSLRVLSVPLRVGPQKTHKSEPSTPKTKSIKSIKGIIALSAQETIK